jgi:hypothetical protein
LSQPGIDENAVRVEMLKEASNLSFLVRYMMRTHPDAHAAALAINGWGIGAIKQIMGDRYNLVTISEDDLSNIAVSGSSNNEYANNVVSNVRHAIERVSCINEAFEAWDIVDLGGRIVTINLLNDDGTIASNII